MRTLNIILTSEEYEKLMDLMENDWRGIADYQANAGMLDDVRQFVMLDHALSPDEQIKRWRDYNKRHAGRH